MKNLAIIPARGGSKRIPKKNIKEFLGKPIISYSIELALQSKLFSKVIVSTDDIGIKEIAEKFGAEVPFMRSAENSDDFATTPDVIEEVIKKLKDDLGLEYDNVCCIYPTAPLISIESLRTCYEKLINDSFDSVFPVVQFSYPILRSLKFFENEKIGMAWPENMNARSQDLPEFYHDAGQFYWLRSKPFMESKKVFSNNATAITLDTMEVQDIDNQSDWEIAELKFQLLHGRKR